MGNLRIEKNPSVVMPDVSEADSKPREKAYYFSPMVIEGESKRLTTSGQMTCINGLWRRAVEDFDPSRQRRNIKFVYCSHK